MSTVPARAVVVLARIEARRLARSPLVLAGFLTGGLLVWIYAHGTQPEWWNGAWTIGYGQVALSTASLIAAQLAVGRSHRDGMTDLYDSFPTGTARRTLAHLLGLLGAVPACLLLIGIVTGVFELHHVVGTPDLAVLVGGVLLVLAGGAVGVAISRRFPHPLAGVLGAFVWFIPFSQSNRISGPITWLFPWIKPAQLGQLPGPLAGYPPGVPHAVELVAIAVLAGTIALSAAVRAKHTRVGLLAAAAAALAAIVITGSIQMQPIPAPDIQNLVNQVAETGPAEPCTTGGQTTGSQVRYCLYPAFASKKALLQSTVGDVLAHVPAQHGRTLTVTQFTGLTLDDGILTNGHPIGQVAAWDARLGSAPVNHPSASAVFVNLGSWPTGGSPAADARFDLALSAAEWAVALPTNTGSDTGPGTGTGTGTDTGTGTGPDGLPTPCVPLNQAREAIAIWLAAQATVLPPSPYQNTSDGITGNEFAQVNGAAVATWSYPGERDDYGDYLASPGAQPTAAGYLLAQAMTNLSAARVTSVLSTDWATWASPQTTDTQLAAALGIPMPAIPTGLTGPHGRLLTPPPGAIPAQPECTT
jgi:hypothetical protein